MFSNKEVSIQLLLIANLIKEKYGLKEVKIRDTKNSDNKVSVMLFNGQFDANFPERDKYNERPIKFFQAHNAEVTQEAHEHHSYYSYSVMTFNKNDVNQIIEGLNVLPSAEDVRPQMVNRC